MNKMETRADTIQIDRDNGKGQQSKRMFLLLLLLPHLVLMGFMAWDRAILEVLSSQAQENKQHAYEFVFADNVRKNIFPSFVGYIIFGKYGMFSVYVSASLCPLSRTWRWRFLIRAST